MSRARLKRAKVYCERLTGLFYVNAGRYNGGEVSELETLLRMLFPDALRRGDVFFFTVERAPRAKGVRKC